MKEKIIKNKKGMLIIETMVFGSIIIIIITALSSWAAVSIKSGRLTINREQAFQSAEAGIEYYRWHLAHAPTDYQDGTNASGPYVHMVKNKDGDIVGQFSLDITAPPIGSTLVKIKSIGLSQNDLSVKRSILSRVAKPSIAKYAFAGNDAMRFGNGTEVFGPIHSNGGIRFDGVAHNIVTSGATTYNDADHDDNNLELGVHTHVRVPPQTGVDETYRPLESNPMLIPSRTDVFETGRLVSQPTIDFSGLTTDLATLQSKAQSNGFYRGAAGGSYVGYHIILKTNNTFDLYKINSWSSLGNCSSIPSGTPSWSINTQTIQGNYSFPENGIIFFQDNLVIDGQIKNARLNIIAATIPVPTNTNNFKNIIINNDLLYTNYNGNDSIGLIAQGGIMVGMKSEDNLKIDAALIAQNKQIGRFYYAGSSCSYKQRSVISLYGMIASYLRYGFAYVDNTGYVTRNIAYDANLLYSPPPDFPLTSDQYQILSWQEVKN
jgi:type II secretory pathway pseudopilin PulG